MGVRGGPEADQRHGELIVKTLGLELSKPVVGPVGDLEAWEDDKEFGSFNSSEYRGLAARANFLALDLSDVQFSVKDICRGWPIPPWGTGKG